MLASRKSTAEFSRFVASLMSRVGLVDENRAYATPCDFPEHPDVCPMPFGSGDKSGRKQMIKNLVKDVSGTAGEALEVRAFKRLNEQYGDPAVVKAIIQRELINSGETWDTLTTYLRFKQKVQRDEISFIRAEKAAQAAARDDLGNLGLGGT
jgi:hypothetical protein